jgi:hypothetical protein
LFTRSIELKYVLEGSVSSFLSDIISDRKVEPKVYAVCGDWCLDFMFNFKFTMNQGVRGYSELSGVRP